MLVAEINYGGRVIDRNDMRLIKALLTKYFAPEVMNDHYDFSESGVIYTRNLYHQSIIFYCIIFKKIKAGYYEWFLDINRDY